MKNSKKLIINLIACLVSFLVTIGISFFLTPYITEALGVEAYGFVGLANNFVNYASIITLAINSMSSRFISISYHRNNLKEANQYFTSVLISNIVLVLIFFISGIFIVLNLEKIIKISPGLVVSVKILFSLIFINFFVSMINTTFSSSTFVKDRIELNNLRTMESNILKTILMISLFSLFGASIVFVGLAYLIASIYLLVFNIYYTYKLMPEIKIKKKYFDFKKIIKIFTSGIWNTITKIGQVLSDGLDLLICNWFVNPVAMGQLAVAKTVSTCTSTLTASLNAIFHPKMTYHYAKEDINSEVEVIKFSMMIGAFFTNLLLAGLISLGLFLFKLWIPSQDIKIIYYATVITIIGAIVGSTINTLFNVFTVTNKLKVNSLVTLALGFLNVLIVYILLKLNLFPNYEIILISGVSVTISLIKNLTFTPIYSAKCLNVKWNTFYKTILRGIISSIVLIITFIIIAKFMMPNTWIKLIFVSIICVLFGAIENYFILFNKNQRKEAINLFKNLLKGRKI